MRGLEHRRLGADVASGRQSQPPDHPRPQVGDDVPVEIGQHDHVVLLGARDELVAEVVDDAVLELDVGVLLRHPPGDVEEQPVGELHDVGLVGRGHPPAAVVLGVHLVELDVVVLGRGVHLDRIIARRGMDAEPPGVAFTQRDLRGAGVDDEIEPPHVGHQLLDCGTHLGFVGDVCYQRNAADLRAHRFSAIAPQIENADLGAPGREPAGCRFTDARAAAGDERDLA